MSMRLERHTSGVWRVVVNGAPIDLRSWFFERGVTVTDIEFVYQLLDAVARPEFGVPERRQGAVPPLGVLTHSCSTCGYTWVHGCDSSHDCCAHMMKAGSLSKELNLDVQAEEARALHRVIRAMHDGHCPNCGYLGPSDEFQQRKSFGAGPSIIDHVCPMCSFTVMHEEARDGLAEFAPFLKKSVELFNAWRKSRGQSTLETWRRRPPIMADT